MCYTISIASDRKTISEKYKRQWKQSTELHFEQNYVIKSFVNPLIPVILPDAPISLFRWGLVPSWTKTLKDAMDIRTYTYNAMSETMFEKPSFKKAAQSQRCAIPVNGFFEWQHLKKNKQPYYIYMQGASMMSLAGLYEIWENPQDGSIWETCNIVTCPANMLLSDIHNSKKRMPVVLDDNLLNIWLHPNSSVEEVLAVCKPYENQPMSAHRVGPRVNGRIGDPNAPESIQQIYDLLS